MLLTLYICVIIRKEKKPMTANINVRTDSETKRKAEEIFNELGINMSTAINMFLKATIRENGVPFSMTMPTPSESTRIAMKEAEDIFKHPENYKGYTDIASLRKALEEDDDEDK